MISPSLVSMAPTRTLMISPGQVSMAMADPFGDDYTDLPVANYVRNSMLFLTQFVQDRPPCQTAPSSPTQPPAPDSLGAGL